MNIREFIEKIREKLRKLFFLNLPVSIDEMEEKKDELLEGIIPQKKEYPHNYLRFSNNIFEPEKRKIGKYNYVMYNARFNNLYELYDYLKDNPGINRVVFRSLASVKDDSDFAGKSYDEAVEDLINEVDPGYEEFLSLQRDLNNARKGVIHKYQTVRTVAGGHLNVPAYSAGNPLCYETEERVVKPKFVRIHITLSYYWGTTKKQVLHRAIIITNILKALENAGYSVDLNAFELSEEENELVYIVVQIKRHGEKMNMSTLYKSLCHVEFLRRILFRVLETLDVTEDWYHGYGSTCSETFVRKALKLGDNDIFFDQPRAMGIEGESLAKDFENAIKHLNLEDKIDVEKAKREFNNDVSVLKKRR
ncbi:MAG: hypothetical protein ACI4XM_01685 [Candidatus Coprovivens sp.]